MMPVLLKMVSSGHRKVRVSLHQRGASGKHLGKLPYGCRRDPEDKDRWNLDEEAAPVAKLIFGRCIDGKGPEAIARIQEEKPILVTKALYAKCKTSYECRKTA